MNIDIAPTPTKNQRSNLFGKVLLALIAIVVALLVTMVSFGFFDRSAGAQPGCAFLQSDNPDFSLCERELSRLTEHDRSLLHERDLNLLREYELSLLNE